MADSQNHEHENEDRYWASGTKAHTMALLGSNKDVNKHLSPYPTPYSHYPSISQLLSLAKSKANKVGNSARPRTPAQLDTPIFSADTDHVLGARRSGRRSHYWREFYLRV
jgi:hypothetical protein